MSDLTVTPSCSKLLEHPFHPRANLHFSLSYCRSFLTHRSETEELKISLCARCVAANTQNCIWVLDVHCVCLRGSAVGCKCVSVAAGLSGLWWPRRHLAPISTRSAPACRYWSSRVHVIAEWSLASDSNQQQQPVDAPRACDPATPVCMCTSPTPRAIDIAQRPTTQTIAAKTICSKFFVLFLFWLISRKDFYIVEQHK